MSEINSVEVLRARALRDSMSLQEALELCDALPSVEIETLFGRWHGSEVSTHHPMDGLLTIFGWYGKEFLDRDHVHPLLFFDRHNRLFAFDPKRLPLSLGFKWPFLRNKLVRQILLLLRFILQTRHAKARLRMVEYRGKVSATMLYDNVPICDAFRLIDQDTLLGIMDFKGMEQPYFFKLHRDK
ncbi:DUF4334 domain-containing protein [Ktedonospora formicarum]|uniref:GXWXG protein n=1 Tax=Ktedonospora formicarum TaxID=2778364 RepID=A0A8J3HYJ7_9CHLR|nr:DUF4334 domain-containing protein [Ktedonospora formicarum]GHO46577.1 hypothetical protein KSX_47400 [Ktedonospora formicarum]